MAFIVGWTYTCRFGGSGDDGGIFGGIGATWIFVFDGSSYQQLGDKLVSSGSVGTSEQGRFFVSSYKTILSYTLKIYYC